MNLIWLRYCIVFLGVMFCLAGCDKKKPIDKENSKDSSAMQIQQEPIKAEYSNDLERLETLTERINTACGRSVSMVFGSENSKVSSGVYSIDYGLFDGLSDDGAAALLAETILNRYDLPPSNKSKVSSVNTIDERIGNCIKAAGFGSAGFDELLEKKKVFEGNLQTDGISIKTRHASFMRGYLSAKIKTK